MRFNHSRLRGRIKEVCGTQYAFADALGLSETTLSAKLNGITDFTRSEIVKGSQILKLNLTDITDIFFCQGDSENTNKKGAVYEE